MDNCGRKINKKSLHHTRNIWTDPRATSAAESRFPEGSTNFPATSFFYISCNSNPSSNHKVPRYSFFQLSQLDTRGKKIPDSSFKRRKIWNRNIIYGCLLKGWFGDIWDSYQRKGVDVRELELRFPGFVDWIGCRKDKNFLHTCVQELLQTVLSGNYLQ